MGQGEEARGLWNTDIGLVHHGINCCAYIVVYCTPPNVFIGQFVRFVMCPMHTAVRAWCRPRI